jgi:hypothetical protein
VAIADSDTADYVQKYHRCFSELHHNAVLKDADEEML